MKFSSNSSQTLSFSLSLSVSFYFFFFPHSLSFANKQRFDTVHLCTNIYACNGIQERPVPWSRAIHHCLPGCRSLGALQAEIQECTYSKRRDGSHCPSPSPSLSREYHAHVGLPSHLENTMHRATAEVRIGPCVALFTRKSSSKRDVPRNEVL